MLDLLEKHYVGATNEIYESYKFFQRSQEDGEPVTDDIAAVGAQAGRCNFNALNFLLENRLIRDRIVCGIRDKGLQRSFLEDSKLTLEKCVEKCKATEQAKKHTAEITADPNRPASKGEQQDVFVARQKTWDKRQSHPGIVGIDSIFTMAQAALGQWVRQRAAAVFAVSFTRTVHNGAQ